jgi:lipopolysaccharide transport system ATP-binding protein
MSQPVIRVEGLGNQYVIGSRDGGQETFREMLTSSFVAPFRRLRRLRGEVAPEERFWALRDVSFEVGEGEIVGVIGRNGAGKSTLLKILSRITEPTEGRVEIRGRVASLLEVGTGFHPELTGRENVYLNGAILGMSRAEIDRKFDEIVAFAEIDQFLDTPVKRYSSGMAVRLAFAVAAHLEPEILVVDEVLAVGDAEFQRKCLNLIENKTASGRTVIFVSHNMDSIKKLCRRALYLKKGRAVCDGQSEETIATYLIEQQPNKDSNIINFFHRGREEFFVDRIEILNASRGSISLPRTWDDVTFRIVFHSPRVMKSGSVVLQISTLSGTVLILTSSQPDSCIETPFKVGLNTVDCRFPRLSLSAGRYRIGAGLAIPNVKWLFKNLDFGVFEVAKKDVFGSGKAPTEDRYCIATEHNWEVNQ